MGLAAPEPVTLTATPCRGPPAASRTVTVTWVLPPSGRVVLPTATVDLVALGTGGGAAWTSCDSVSVAPSKSALPE